MRAKKILYREFWGEAKRHELLESLAREGEAFNQTYASIAPDSVNRFSLRRAHTASAFFDWVNIRELAAVEPISGLQEMRRNRLISDDKAALEQAIEAYLNPKRTLAELTAAGFGPTKAAGRFDPEVARNRVLQAGKHAVAIRRYAFQPFDTRWCAWTAVRPVWNEPRPELARQIDGENPVFITRMIAERPHEQLPAIVTRALPDYHLLRPNIVAFPFMLSDRATFADDDLLARSGIAQRRSNLAPRVVGYLSSRGVIDPAHSADAAGLIWFHALAVCCAPAYVNEYGPSLRQGCRRP